MQLIADKLSLKWISSKCFASSIASPISWFSGKSKMRTIWPCDDATDDDGVDTDRLV